MPDNFYKRLDFYRMLYAGRSDLSEIAEALGVSVRTLRRWREAYDPGHGSFDPVGEHASAPEYGMDHEPVDGNVSRPARGNLREEIIAAVRQVALEGNVPAAKLLLSEYRDDPTSGEDILTVEKAVELLRKWGKDRPRNESCGDETQENLQL